MTQDEYYKLIDDFERVIREDEHEDSDSSNASVRVCWRRLREAFTGAVPK